MPEKMEILNHRLFEVAPHILFDAVADPEKLKQWWGPQGFTNRIYEFDFRVGGDWRVIMTSPDGTDFPNRSTFREIVPAERIVFLHHEPMHVYTMEMRFTAEQGGTRLRWRMLFEPTEENLQLEKFIAVANEQNFDRLENLFQKMNGEH